MSAAKEAAHLPDVLTVSPRENRIVSIQYDDGEVVLVGARPARIAAGFGATVGVLDATAPLDWVYGLSWLPLRIFGTAVLALWNVEFVLMLVRGRVPEWPKGAAC